MTEQASLFPDLVPVDLPPVERLSPDRRRTARQHANVAAGIHPLTLGPTLPAGTCGSCALRSPGGHHAYPKCMLRSESGRLLYVTHSAATDCRAWWPACTAYQPR